MVNIEVFALQIVIGKYCRAVVIILDKEKAISLTWDLNNGR